LRIEQLVARWATKSMKQLLDRLVGPEDLASRERR
jgi:hypothetical protein